MTLRDENDSANQAAMIAAESRARVAEVLSVDYAAYFEPPAPALSAKEINALADAELSYEWIGRYQDQCAETVDVLSIKIEAYTFLWDQIYQRVVAVYGVNETHAKRRRDKSRIAYYFRNFMKRYQASAATDTGHFIAHAIGGGLDMNLFPQKREINQGRSAEGRAYRNMERYVAARPGTFVFSRPIYFDDSWRPYFLEYGYANTSENFTARIFDNL